jgi:hypothetical protein
VGKGHQTVKLTNHLHEPLYNSSEVRFIISEIRKIKSMFFFSSTFQRNLLFPYSGYKRSLFYPDDRGSRFIQNAGNYLPGYMA